MKRGGQLEWREAKMRRARVGLLLFVSAAGWPGRARASEGFYQLAGDVFALVVAALLLGFSATTFRLWPVSKIVALIVGLFLWGHIGETSWWPALAISVLVVGIDAVLGFASAK